MARSASSSAAKYALNQELWYNFSKGLTLLLCHHGFLNVSWDFKSPDSLRGSGSQSVVEKNR